MIWPRMPVWLVHFCDPSPSRVFVRHWIRILDTYSSYPVARSSVNWITVAWHRSGGRTKQPNEKPTSTDGHIYSTDQWALFAAKGICGLILDKKWGWFHESRKEIKQLVTGVLSRDRRPIGLGLATFLQSSNTHYRCYTMAQSSPFRSAVIMRETNTCWKWTNHRQSSTRI